MSDIINVRDRFAGSIIGSACGDALGHKIEFMSLKHINDVYGPQGIEFFPDPAGQITDDTQMSLAVINGFADHGKLTKLELGEEVSPFDISKVLDCLTAETARTVSKRFIGWMLDPMGGHRAPGNACLAGCRAMAIGTNWGTAGGIDAGGCGAIMRSGPYGLMFSLIGDDPVIAAAAASDVASIHAKMTHGHPMGFASAGAHAAAVAMGVRGASIDDTVGSMIGVLDSLDASHATAKRFVSMLDRFDGKLDPDIFVEFPAWRGDDALISAAHILMVHGDDLLAAIRAAVNIGGDSDSLGAVVGSLVGARTGASAVMGPDWFGRLEFKDVIAKGVDDAVTVAEALSGKTLPRDV